MNCSQTCVAVPESLSERPELVATKGAWPQVPVEDRTAAKMGAFSLRDSSWATPVEHPTAPLLPVWDERRYWFQSVLASTSLGGGQIELYLDLHTGAGVVAKRFPAEQLYQRPATPGIVWDPWREMEITQCLGNAEQGQKVDGVCNCYGAFRDARGDALLLSEYFPGGDLFELASGLGEPGPEREAKVWPILRSFLGAVLSLHDANVAHGDVSLENALWPDANGGVVLIDFEAAIVGNLGAASGTRGKPAYQAPEMHTQRSYDARAADLFSCGVVAYMLAVGAYPWSSTKPGVCPSFSYAKQHGVEAFLGKKSVRLGREGQPTPVRKCMSSTLAHLVCSLLSLRPAERLDPLELLDNLEMGVSKVDGSIAADKVLEPPASPTGSKGRIIDSFRA